MKNQVIKFFNKTLMPVLLIFAMLLAIMPAVYTVDAGISGGYVVDSGKLEGNTIETAYWVKADNVELVDGVLHFTNKYGRNDPMLSRQESYSSKEIAIALDVNFDLDVRALLGNKKFGFVYGFDRLDSKTPEQGKGTFVYFAPLGSGLGFGVLSYETGTETELKPLTSLGEVGKYKVNLKIGSNGSLIVVINGSTVCTTDAQTTAADGYVGFTSTGALTTSSNYVDIYLSNVSIKNEYYAKPQTPKYSFADFDEGDFNTEEWFLFSTRVGADGDGLVAKNGKLSFDMAGQNSSFSTRHKYSNFELQFDISGAKNTPSISPTSGKVQGCSYWFAIAWGMQGDNVAGSAINYSYVTDLIRFDHSTNNETYGKHPGDEGYDVRRGSKTGVSFSSKTAGSKSTSLPEKYSFFAEDFTDTVRIKIRMIDGEFYLGMKLDSEVEYTEILTYQYPNGICPYGFISLRGEGNQFTPAFKQLEKGSCYDLDNISLFNYDNKPVLVSVDYNTNRLTAPGDFDYKDPYTDDYLITNTGGKPSKK